MSSALPHALRGKRLNLRHRRQTFTNRTRKGINRIQIRIVILISVGYRRIYASPMNPQQSWGFDGEPPEAVMKDSATRDGTLFQEVASFICN